MLVVPFDELPEFRAHEAKLLARVRKLIAVKAAQCRKLLLVRAEHFVQHRFFAVHDLVMRVGENKILRKSVHHGKCQLIMLAGAKQRVGRKVIERIVHIAHVPLEAEAKPADFRRHGDHGVGRRLLGNGDRPRILGQNGGVELAQKLHCGKVNVAALGVRRVLAVLSAVVEVQHRAHGVDTDAVNMVVFKKAACRGDEKRLNLRHGIVKNERAPLGVVCHTLFLALKQPRAVKQRKPVRIPGKVRRYPVHDNTDAGIVQDIDKFGKLVGCAVACGGSVVARDLIAPRAGERVFRQWQQLNVCVAHVGAVACKLMRRFHIVHAAVGFGFPRAEVQLVYRHRLRERITPCTPVHVLAVRPFETACPHPRRRVKSRLRPAGEGVGLEHLLAAFLCDAVFVQVAVTKPLDKADPHCAALFHGRCIRVPTVEVADKAHRFGIRRPHHEAMHLYLRQISAAQQQPSLAGITRVKQENIVLRQVFIL